MDPALAIELEALSHQKWMNKVIDRGDSAVQQFYRGATVFVTGGSGFIGKQLIEKIFRSCEIKKMYLLMRPKKGKTIQERLHQMLRDPVFNLVREKRPHFENKIEPVEGDVAYSNLGLSDAEWAKLSQEVNAIFHEAATIRFDAPLRSATLTNVRGTKETLALARACSGLKCYVYISTAFSHTTKERVGKPLLEQFYPCPVPPHILISLAEDLDEQRLDSITDSLIAGWPNTYTFTKAVAEEMIRNAEDLPVCIVRPPIVFPAYYEPAPGWLDISAVQGPSGILLGIYLAVLHVFLVNKNSKMAMTPVDFVNNVTIAAAWDAAERRRGGSADVQVYNVSDKDYFINWNFIRQTMIEEGSKLCTPKAVWLCELIETDNKYLYWVLAWLLHYIPAYLLDIVCAVLGRRPKGIKSFVGLYKKVDKFASIYHYFLSNVWEFNNDNVRAMVGRMSDADKAIYNCDLASINTFELVKVWGIGLRKYIIKDGLKGTEAAYRKQSKYRMASYILLAAYGYLIWTVLCVPFNIVKYIFGI